MPRTLVVGATGYLGRHLVSELRRRGHTLRIVARDKGRAEGPGPFQSPPLRGLIDDWRVGDITDPRNTRNLTEGMDHVVSALGVTRQKADPWLIDNRANLTVLHDAIEHQVSTFTYVNVLGGDNCPAPLARAKTAFDQALQVSPLTSQTINPPGYFSDMTQILDLARRRFVPLLNPRMRINPIHGADLAAYIADRVEQGETGRWDVGGPDVFTWAELVKLAADTVGCRAHIVRIPAGVIDPMLRVLSVPAPDTADTARFTTWSMRHDTVGIRTGYHHLADFYQAISQGTAARLDDSLT